MDAGRGGEELLDRLLRQRHLAQRIAPEGRPGLCGHRRWPDPGNRKQRRGGAQGVTWTAMTRGLPANGAVLAIAEDPVKPNLLFAGTEFGLYFTVDSGQKWIRLQGGLPTIAVRDLTIQKRENDLVLATFGR